MQQRSSITITAPEPSIVPTFAIESKSSGVSTSSALMTGTDEPPGMIAFSSRPPGNAAAEVEDQRAERRAQLELVVAAVHDVAGEGEDAGAGRVLDSELRVLLGAEPDDVGHGRDRLDVVDQRRRGVEARDGGERRLRSRLPALALERLEKRGFLAADVRARPAMEDDRDRGVRAEHVRAHVTRLQRLLERRPDDLVLGQVLPADVDEGDLARRSRG